MHWNTSCRKGKNSLSLLNEGWVLGEMPTFPSNVSRGANHQLGIWHFLQIWEWHCGTVRPIDTQLWEYSAKATEWELDTERRKIRQGTQKNNNQKRINQLKAEKRRVNAQRSPCNWKEYKKGGENPSPSPTTKRLHFSDVLLPRPSSQGVPKYSSKQTTGDELNVTKCPERVESFVTKKHSRGEKGPGNQFSRKALQARKKEEWQGDENPREGSEMRTVRAEKAVCAGNREEGLENSSAWCPAGVWGQGSLRRSILARSQGGSLGPGLTCFSKGEGSEKDHWTWRVLINCKHAKIPRHLTGSGHESDAGRDSKTLRSNRQNKRFPSPWWPYVAFHSTRDHFSLERTIHSIYNGTLRELGYGGHENWGGRQGKGCSPFSYP